MSTTTYKHFKFVNGAAVKKSRSTLAQAAEEYAATLVDAPGGKGRVVFTCPNYAVVQGIREHTIWAR